MTDKKVLTLREQIFACNDIEEQEVIIEQWGNKKLIVRGLTGAQRDNAVNEASDKKGNLDDKKFNYLLIIASVIDPDTGENVFQPNDFVALAGKNVAAIETLGDKVMKLSGLGEEAEKEASKN